MHLCAHPYNAMFIFITFVYRVLELCSVYETISRSIEGYVCAQCEDLVPSIIIVANNTRDSRSIQQVVIYQAQWHNDSRCNELNTEQVKFIRLKDNNATSCHVG